MLECLVSLLFLAGMIADLMAKPRRNRRAQNPGQPQGLLERGVAAHRQWDDARAMEALAVLMLAEEGVFLPGTDEVFYDGA